MDDTTEARIEKLEDLARSWANLRITLDALERVTYPAVKELDKLVARVEHVAKVIRPGVDELHRRAVLEAELAENASHQRHRIDRFEAGILRNFNDLEYRVFRLEHPWRYMWIDLCAKVKLWTGGRLG